MAAGKSEALGALERLGAATISADRIVHDLLDREPMLSRMRERWGERAARGGRADRELIGSTVFSDPDELAWLERQVHPLVRDELAVWLGGLPADTEFAVAEVPLLFEGEMADRFDHTVAIVAAEKVRRERAAARGQVGLEGREGRQLDQSGKADRADFVISNDGTKDDLERKLAMLLDRIGSGTPTDDRG